MVQLDHGLSLLGRHVVNYLALGIGLVGVLDQFQAEQRLSFGRIGHEGVVL